MTAKEAMQALLDGREVYRRDGNDPEYIHTYKLSGEGKIVERCDDKWWGVHTELNHIEGIVDEYPLDFEQALRAMLDGKVVKCESFINSRRFHDGEFQFMDGTGGWIQVNWFEDELQKGKWKVVE